MTLQSLVDRANAIPKPFTGRQFPRPTSGSIEHINSHFGIVLPRSFLEFVRCWRSSSSWFASIGNDYQSLDHIIQTNSYWRTRGLPDNLVIFNRGFDDDLDCFDITTLDESTGEYRIAYWTPGQQPRELARDFLQYMNIHITGWEPHRGRHTTGTSQTP